MDYRQSSLADLKKVFTKLTTAGQERQEMLNDLAKVAIWHSIKDGQITPARSLHGALGRTDAAREVVNFLQKHGNIGWGTVDKASQAKGIIFKNKLDIKYTEENKAANLDYANSVYEALPDVWQQFSNEPRELMDFDFDRAIKRLAGEMRRRIEAGKKIIYADKNEEKIAKEILEAVPLV